MSMMLEQYVAMAAYNRLMNEAIYTLAGRLDDAERRRDRSAFFKSLHGTLGHLVLTDRAWLMRFTGDIERFYPTDAAGRRIPIQGLDTELYEDFEELRAARGWTDAEIETFVAGLDEQRLAATLAYTTTAGATHEHPMWWALTHFFNHQTQSPRAGRNAVDAAGARSRDDRPRHPHA